MSNLCNTCSLQNNDNTNEILLNQIRNEIRELSKTTTARLLIQDGKIAELCVYLKDNLSNSIRELLDVMEKSGEFEQIIHDILDTDLTRKLGFVSLRDFGGLDNGVADNSNIINTLSGQYPVIDLMGLTYVITNPVTLENTTLQNGTIIYRGKKNETIVHLLSGSGLKNIKLVNETEYFENNYVLIDYTKDDEQWIKRNISIDGVTIENAIDKTFRKNSTAFRIVYDKYKVITMQTFKDVRFYGLVDYGVYIEPMLRDEKDNPVYNSTIFENVFLYSANCALKVLPKMTTGNVENARGGVGLYLNGFFNQNVDGMTRAFMDLHNTNIEGGLIIPWDYYGDRIPAEGVYKTHNSNIAMNVDMMTVERNEANVYSSYKRLSTGETYSSVHAVKPKNVGNDAPARSTGIAWGVDNIKSVVFKPELNNPYELEYIGFELQRNNKSVSKNRTVQFGVSTSGAFVWRQYIEGEGWSDLHTIYSQGKVPTSYVGKRPDGLAVGDMKFDTTLNAPVWWNGEKWVKADGTEV